MSVTFFVFPGCFRVIEATNRTCHYRKRDSFWSAQDTSHYASAISGKANWFWSMCLSQLVCALFTYLSLIFDLNCKIYAVKSCDVIILCTWLTPLHLMLENAYCTLFTMVKKRYGHYRCNLYSDEVWYYNLQPVIPRTMHSYSLCNTHSSSWPR